MKYVWMVIIFALTGCGIKHDPDPPAVKSEYGLECDKSDITPDESGITYRCINKEMICYIRSSSGISCVKKEQ